MTPAKPLKGAGEACRVSTECEAELRCVNDQCTSSACSSATDCRGTPSDGCGSWACVAGLCVSACLDAGMPEDTGVVVTDAEPPPRDAEPPRDADPAPDADAGVVEDADTPPGDTGMDDTGASPPDTGEPPPDSGEPPPDTGVDAGVADTGVCDPVARRPMAGELYVNELLADPGDDVMTGDANRDGIRDSADDEFVEIANVSSTVLELNGIVVFDAMSLKHRFTARTLSCGQVIVVFGGGNTAHAAWQPNWVIASSGGLSLNNSGDTIRIGTSTATPDNIASEVYTSAAGMNQSLVRRFELMIGSAYVQHTQHPDSGNRPFSAGTRVNGSPF